MAEKEVEIPVTLNSQPMNKRLQEAKQEFGKLKNELVQGFTDIAQGGIAAGIAGSAASAGLAGARSGFGAASSAFMGYASGTLFADFDAEKVARQRALMDTASAYRGLSKEDVERNSEEIKRLNDTLYELYKREEQGTAAVKKTAYGTGDAAKDAAVEFGKAAAETFARELIGKLPGGSLLLGR